MVSSTRLFTNISLQILIAVLIFHLIAMGYPKWKIYEHRTEPSKTMFVGIFQRCEYFALNITDYNKLHSICDDLLYMKNDSCCTESTALPRTRHRFCNLAENRNDCDYSPIGKSLIACTIIAACTIGVAFLATFSHLFIGEFKYKVHFGISILTIILLFLGFAFLLATMIIVGSTLPYDLYQYEYNLNCRFSANSSTIVRETIYNKANSDYVIRLDWAGAMEIIALIGSSFALLSQIFYLISTYRNKIG